MKPTEQPIEHDPQVIIAALKPRTTNVVVLAGVLLIFLSTMAVIAREDFFAAFPELRRHSVGIAGLAVAGGVLCGIVAFLAHVARENGFVHRRGLTCPACKYEISARWNPMPFEVDQVIICSECGKRSSGWAYAAAVCPSGRAAAWREAISPNRSAIRTVCFVVGAIVICVCAAMLIDARAGRHAGFNLAGIVIAAGALGCVVGVMLLDASFRSRVAAMRETSRCREGHDGLEGVVVQSRVLYWCPTCDSGWWAPTRKEDFLHACVDTIARERVAFTEEPPQGEAE